MPNKTKYPRELKDRVYAMYHEDRKVHEKYTKGRYKLREISEKTGIPVNMVCMIGKGER